jgi:3-deoxy-D-manno-octulosonic-acid transferase
VIFGPCHGKFREASGLLLSGGGFSVSDAAEFGALMDTLISDTDMLFTSGCSAFDYVADNLGATQIIFDRIFIKP